MCLFASKVKKTSYEKESKAKKTSPWKGFKGQKKHSLRKDPNVKKKLVSS